MLSRAFWAAGTLVPKAVNTITEVTSFESAQHAAR
jgi:hypothetical protein